MRAEKQTSRCRANSFIAREEQAVTISDLKAGLWDGSLDVARFQVPLASKEKKLRFEAQLKLDGVRLQSIINIFGEARKQPGVIPLDWKGAWRISGAGEIPWITLRTSAGMVTWHSMAEVFPPNELEQTRSWLVN